MSESRIDFTELREVVEAAVRYEAAIDAYERTPDGEDGGAQLQEYAAARAAWVQATNTESGMATLFARFAPVFARLDALERVAEAAEACNFICEKIPEFSMIGPGEEWPRCGECRRCKLRAALDALHRRSTRCSDPMVKPSTGGRERGRSRMASPASGCRRSPTRGAVSAATTSSPDYAAEALAAADAVLAPCPHCGKRPNEGLGSMTESSGLQTTHYCYGSYKNAPWEAPDSYGRVTCPSCHQLVRLREDGHTFEPHDAPGAPLGV